MFAYYVLVLVCFAEFTLQAEWSYNYETQWPGVCNVGRQQSPINIMTQDAVVDTHQVHIRGPLIFKGYQNAKLTAINNGHTLQWAAEDGPAPTLSGGPLRGNYTLMQFHLHWLSEHAIDGMKYPLEIHFVHIKTGLSLDEALSRPDGLAVVGVMCIVSNRYGSSRAFEQIIPVVPNLLDSSQNRTGIYDIDVSRLLSSAPQSYYTYHGSLTTPTCEEVVTWIVMDKPIYISSEQYNLFGKVDVGGNYNYRSLQPTNRVVYRSIASCASLLIPSIPTTLISLLSCLSSNFAAGVNKGVCSIMNINRKLFGNTMKQCVKLN